MADKYGFRSQAEWDQLFQEVEAAVKANPDHPLMVGKPEGNPVQIRPPWAPTSGAWVQGVNAVGGARWEAGIQNPRAVFKDAAIANNDGWKAGVNAAVAADKFRTAMQAVDVDAAIQTAVKVGAAGYAAGAALRADKYQRAVDAVKAKMSAVTAATRAMPAATLPQRVARAVNQIQGAAAAGKSSK